MSKRDERVEVTTPDALNEKTWYQGAVKGGTCVPSLSVFDHCKVGGRRGHSEVLAGAREQRHHGAVCGTNTRGQRLATNLSADRGTRIQGSGVPSHANCAYCP